MNYLRLLRSGGTNFGKEYGVRRVAAGLAGFAICALSGANAQPAAGLADLSLEELGEVEVLSVSRQPERLADAPASVYVITNEQIRRSGATNLGEALRNAPNLQVARISAVNYAITARGFNSAFANKLLVLIDGRTVYTPLFSGVFWDQQDVLLNDVDRIEVISGPGATLWGANAVNGVINIITRAANDTQGGFASVSGGNFENHAAFRYGGTLGEHGHFRAYVKASSLESTKRASGMPALDAWERQQAGFRADWSGERDTFTLQADVHGGRSEDRGSFAGFAFGRLEANGANVLGRWTHDLDRGGELRVQTYFDHGERDDALFFRPQRDTFDVEMQHSIPLESHDLLWGAGYRRASDDIGTGFVTTFIPGSRDLEWGNVFVQDRFRLAATLDATIGLKLERNDYTGVESLPSARIAWKPSSDRLLWAAVSRAVRAPARFDRDVFFPGEPPFFVIGGPNFQSEVADVLEIGYRVQVADRLTYSITVFEHDWDKLRSGTSLPVELENRIEGAARGLESWVTWRLARRWELGGGVSTLDMSLRLEPGSTDPVGTANPTLANDADHQWMLRASGALGAFALNFNIRRVDALPLPRVPAYTAVDAQFAWQPHGEMRLALSARNLFDAGHPEFEDAASRSELPRTVLLTAEWHFGG